MVRHIDNCLRRIALVAMLALACLQVSAQDEARREVMLETSLGNVRIALYNETPIHRDNFLRLVESGFYDGIAFHRVIYGFMIQAGDPATRDSAVVAPQVELKKIPAEIHFPQLFHKRGCIAAAREGDNVNPERMSSAS